MSKQQASAPAAQEQQATASAAQETKTKTISEGVLVGRASDRLRRLEAEEQEALAQSPATIKAAFAKKREAALKGLNEAQKKGAIAMADALRPQPAEASKAAE